MIEGDRKNVLEKEIRKRIKDAFGKGPESIEISDFESTVTIVLKGFLTKVEKIRLEESGGIEGVRKFRYEELRKEIVEMLEDESIYGGTIESIYLDVHSEEDRACFTVLKKNIG